MATYAQPTCEYIYKVSSLEKVVDGDTIDVTIDLGFDVCTRQRVRLLGIDTPESRRMILRSNSDARNETVVESLGVFWRKCGCVKMVNGLM
jgi:endonuclease YncB( thermonuclease family)